MTRCVSSRSRDDAPVIAGAVRAFVSPAGGARHRRGVGQAAQQLVGDEGVRLGSIAFVAVRPVGLSHTVFGTATRPRSCTSAAASAAGPQASRASAATACECPPSHGDFRSEKSASTSSDSCTGVAQRRGAGCDLKGGIPRIRWFNFRPPLPALPR